MAPARGILDKQAYTRASTRPRSVPTHTHPDTHTHILTLTHALRTHTHTHTHKEASAHTYALTHARARTRTHIHKYVILITFHVSSCFVKAPQCCLSCYEYQNKQRLYTINVLVFITDIESVYCAVRAKC